MKITNSKEEVQRAVSSILSAFDSIAQENAGKRYSVLLGFASPIFEDKNDSEVKSLLSTVERIVAQFPGESQISLQLDIVEYSNVANQISDKAKEVYDATSLVSAKPKIISVQG